MVPSPTDTSASDSGNAQPGRWQVLRDVISFQFKLFLDSGRDFLLSPISLIAAAAGIFTRSDDPGRYFYALMKYGRSTDRWINLFGADSHHSETTGADLVVKQAEDVIRGHYEKSEIIRSLKEHADSVIDNAQASESKTKDSSQP